MHTCSVINGLHSSGTDFACMSSHDPHTIPPWPEIELHTAIHSPCNTTHSTLAPMARLFSALRTHTVANHQ